MADLKDKLIQAANLERKTLSAKKEIHATTELLKSWGCLNNLTKGELERIHDQLTLIATSAIHDYKNGVNDVSDLIINELKK